MVDELQDLLVELDRAWADHGFSASTWFAPGMNEPAVREALDRFSIRPCQEVIDWFCWHNGTSAPDPNDVLEPSGFSLLSLEESVSERASRLEGAKQLSLRVADPSFPATRFWDPSWIPIGRMLNVSVLAVDSESDAIKGPVHVVDWQDLDSSGAPVAASLSDAVRVWLAVLGGDYFQWVDMHWQYDLGAVPTKFRESGLIR